MITAFKNSATAMKICRDSTQKLLHIGIQNLQCHLGNQFSAVVIFKSLLAPLNK